MAVDYKELLRRPADSLKKPPLKPSGTYLGVVKEYRFDMSKEKKTPYVRFTFNNLSPGPDVEASQLVDPEDGSSIDLSRWSPHKDFFLTDDSIYRLKDFLTSLGIPSQGRMLDEMLPESRGMAVAIQVTQETTKDEKARLFNSIGDVTGQ